MKTAILAIYKRQGQKIVELTIGNENGQINIDSPVVRVEDKKSARAYAKTNNLKCWNF